MTHKIAIITTGHQSYDTYADDYTRVVESISDWQEVTSEEYKCLKAMEGRLGYHVLEQPADTGAFVKKTVADYLVYIKAEEEKAAREKKKRDDAALERKIKKELKDKVSKEAMLKKLVDELGPDAVQSLIT